MTYYEQQIEDVKNMSKDQVKAVIFETERKVNAQARSLNVDKETEKK